jgi:hypothetical protein
VYLGDQRIREQRREGADGGPNPGNGDLSIVEEPSGDLDWYSLVEFTENLQDKFVGLCVCHGYCEDTTCAFVTATSLCLSLVAPEAELTADEASSFFPDFLKAVDSVSIESVDPNDIRRALESTNRLAEKKMRLYSLGLSSE